MLKSLLELHGVELGIAMAAGYIFLGLALGARAARSVREFQPNQHDNLLGSENNPAARPDENNAAASEQTK